MRGLLRCQFKLQQWADAVPNAKELLQQKGLATDDRMMANMVIAKDYQNNNELFEASAAYKDVVAAESRSIPRKRAITSRKYYTCKGNILKPRKQALRLLIKPVLTIIG